ncbi:hypothetical protein C1H46_039975 [Malus baccata]|uniref:Uncharacterized protein n=1 Tax=Malus baccata TaxID=106549 RepID=A0A540KJU3_MALBA|nr:hypothetical protein C1H46_039975 [Malus baccata]
MSKSTQDNFAQPSPAVTPLGPILLIAAKASPRILPLSLSCSGIQISIFPTQYPQPNQTSVSIFF